MNKKSPTSSIYDTPGNSEQYARIRAIAAELFADKGFHAVGMTELCSAVGLGRGALYHHIRSKEDLLYDISREYITGLVERVTRIMEEVDDPVERVTAMGEDLITTIAANQSELKLCFREVRALTGERQEHIRALHTRYERAWRQVVKDGEKKGDFRAFESVELKGLLGMYFYSYLWMDPKGSLAPKGIARHFNRLALKMLTA